MRQSVLLIIFSLLTTNIIFAGKVDSKDLLLINSLRNYENDAHVQFQEELYKSSENYFRSQSEKFVENETGFFKLWSEASRVFESETKKNARWKSRIEKYFRATEYISYIENKQSTYSNTINQQRKELLGKLHHDKIGFAINSRGIETISVSKDKIDKVVDKVNSLVLTEVIPEVLEAIMIPLIISLLAFVVGIFFRRVIGGLLIIISLSISIWQSVKYSNELESQINESFALKEKQHLVILPELQLNTTAYYKELISKIK